ncbi:hypothetical protein ACA910_001757 [Epithemia clementina (nom. ined.)]
MGGFDQMLSSEGGDKLVWILPTILCIVLASAIYSSQQKLKSIDEEERQARTSRAKNRENRALNPFDTSSRESVDEGGGGGEDVSSSPSDSVWEERRRRGITATSSSASKMQPAKQNGSADKNNNKPFQSSYYYAHNSSNAKGGYSDGLSIEDFTMNGPRLLSKGGKPIATEKKQQQEQDEPMVNLNDNAKSKSLNKSNSSMENSVCLNITKYLWDDPGDSSGIACIRVDMLPSPSNPTQMVPWKDANIVEASAELVNDSKGLLVVARSADKVEYRLDIKQLHGSVASAKALTAKMKKRLIIQLHKTKGFFDRSNLDAWPQPHKKI